MTETNHIFIEVVSNDQEMERLGKEWKQVTAKLPGSSVFYWYDWLAAAWEWKQGNSDLAIVVVRKHDRIVAIWPLVRRRKKILGMDVHILDYLAIPDTQECDVLCVPEFEVQVGSAIVEWLESSGNWVVLRMQRIPAQSFVLRRLLPQLSASSLILTMRPHDKNLTLSLESSWEDYYARRSRRLKKGNNLVANRLAKRFNNVAVQRLRLSDLDEFERNSVLQDLRSVSQKSWKEEETDTTFAAEGPSAFLARLTDSVKMREHTVIWRLLLDSHCVATELQLVADGVVSALRSDFDREYSEHSPGTFLNRELLERQFDENLVSYRMGPGSNTYKLRWSEEATELSELSIYSRSFRGRLLFAYLENVKPFFRRKYEFIKNIRKDRMRT